MGRDRLTGVGVCEEERGRSAPGMRSAAGDRRGRPGEQCPLAPILPRSREASQRTELEASSAMRSWKRSERDRVAFSVSIAMAARRRAVARSIGAKVAKTSARTSSPMICVARSVIRRDCTVRVAPSRDEVRPPDQQLHLARRRSRHRSDPGARGAHGRRRRLRLDLGHGPLLPDPWRRPTRGADARGPDRARLHRRQHRSGADRPDGRRHPLPRAGPVGEGDDHPRRALRWSSLVRHRCGVERHGVEGPRLRVPAAQGALRVAGGHAALRPRDVVGAAAARTASSRARTCGRRT